MTEENPETINEDISSDSSSPVAESPVRKKSWFGRYMAVSTVLVIGVIIYLGFFSEMSVQRAISYKKTIDSLQMCINEQQDSLDYYRDLNRRLSVDPALTEQVVREQYNMKRDNEDIYVFK